eukprot:TRINITY_DN60484_c0_g1_i1.p1 TRINITY_DN60484_c0_g1~~TRINITY_DN60484_c0_g1_i1.p1  ORF type:complete len:691 (+),score=31.79 TRINITY_DN60484_c0_g1_i1:58-2130(+)
MLQMNYANASAGAFVVSVSSEVEDSNCTASNLLIDDTSKLWLAKEPPPQSITISIKTPHPPLGYFGWHCWHNFTTNPKKVQVFSNTELSDDSTWECCLSAEAYPGSGTQMYELHTKIPENHGFLRISLLENFGGSLVYMNRLYLFENYLTNPNMESPVDPGGTSTPTSPSYIHAHEELHTPQPLNFMTPGTISSATSSWSRPPHPTSASSTSSSSSHSQPHPHADLQQLGHGHTATSVTTTTTTTSHTSTRSTSSTSSLSSGSEDLSIAPTPGSVASKGMPAFTQDSPQAPDSGRSRERCVSRASDHSIGSIGGGGVPSESELSDRAGSLQHSIRSIRSSIRDTLNDPPLPPLPTTSQTTSNAAHANNSMNMNETPIGDGSVNVPPLDMGEININYGQTAAGIPQDELLHLSHNLHEQFHSHGSHLDSLTTNTFHQSQRSPNPPQSTTIAGTDWSPSPALSPLMPVPQMHTTQKEPTHRSATPPGGLDSSTHLISLVENRLTRYEAQVNILIEDQSAMQREVVNMKSRMERDARNALYVTMQTQKNVADLVVLNKTMDQLRAEVSAQPKAAEIKDMVQSQISSALAQHNAQQQRDRESTGLSRQQQLEVERLMDEKIRQKIKKMGQKVEARVIEAINTKLNTEFKDSVKHAVDKKVDAYIRQCKNKIATQIKQELLADQARLLAAGQLAP